MTTSSCQASRVFVYLTTVPPRLARTGALLEVLASLHSQNPSPEAVILHVPQRYERWPNATFVVPAELLTLPWLRISRPLSDEGPAAKVLGLRLAGHHGEWDPGNIFIEDARQDDIVIFTDDDNVKRPCWLAGLTSALQPGSAVAYRSHPLDERSPAGAS